ncbi:MAG: lipoyl(octanoyl) transferase LipB [Phycisphaerales bacterium]
MNELFDVVDLGRMAYAPAYAEQVRRLEAVVAARDSQGPRADVVLLVEHDPPVVTISRRPGAEAHLIATADQLARAGVTLEQTDRGGDITYHGPGQLVVYPILDLNRFHLRLHEYMRLLESAVIDVCARFGVKADRDACATGVWVPHASSPTTHAPFHPACDASSAPAAKICAMGVRVRRWVSMHGLALNVTTNLDHFGLIVPCGLAGRAVTSLERELRNAVPLMPAVKTAIVDSLAARLREHISATARHD